MTCPRCKGQKGWYSGYDPWPEFHPCEECEGTGEVDG